MRNTKWAAKTIPNPRQEREYIERDNKQKNDKKTKKMKKSKTEKQNFENTNLSSVIDNDILKILYSRGITTEKEIREFLNPKLENIQNPYGLQDMEKTVLEIEKAIKEQKNIWIYGDYDVDGITSTSILYMALKELGAENVNYYIPIRDEGYGLNNEALKKIKKSGADLVITVDCGITAFPEVEFANSINLPIIITDHHNLHGDKVPDAITVVNPKRPENDFSFEFLAGVGTIFMVILCLYERIGKKAKAYKYLDLVAIGTVADIVPLVEENRILTKFGLEQLSRSKNKGLRFLLYKLFSTQNSDFNEKTEYNSYDVGFIIAPVFNAAGRLKDAKMVVKLLISDNDREIEIIVKELINKNFERKELQNEIVEKVEKHIEESDLKEDYVIVDYSPEYHHGVIGIAASKIVDKYYKPAIIIEVKEDEGIAVGSCRSIGNFSILEALQSMPELFVKFGGHSGAAGFTIGIKNLELFKKKINKFAKTKLKEEDFVKIIEIDKQIPIQKVSYEFFQIIELLKPFGFGNPMPTFRTNNVLFENIKFIGENKNHIMFDIKQKGFFNRNAVWFNSGEYFKELNENLFYDIVYKLKTEMFQDRYYTKVYIEDVKVSKLKDDTLLYYHSLFNTSFPIKSVFYTNIELESEKKITMKAEFDQISLFQGRKFIGRLDYGISNLLILLNRYYNWNFAVKIENVKQTSSHNIVNILIKKDYNFKCYDHLQAGIFKKIKEFLIGKMEYNSQTKNLLAQFFKQNKNLIIKNIFGENEKYKYKISNFENFLLTIGIYYKKITGKKSQIVINSEKEPTFNNFIKTYFDINEKYSENDYPFTLFYNYENLEEMEKIVKDDFSVKNEIIYDAENKNIAEIEVNEEIKQLEYRKVEKVEYKNSENTEKNVEKQEKNIQNSNESEKKQNLEFEKRFCIIVNSENLMIKTKKLAESNIMEINTQIEVPKNVVFLENSTKKERKKAKNIFLEYLPIEEKIKLKKLLEDGEKIYSDYSINEIL